MSRFKNEVAHLQAHLKTLRLGAGALFVVALLLGFGWWSAPKSLTIHVPRRSAVVWLEPSSSTKVLSGAAVRPVSRYT